jgi:hypothetical protein
MVGYTLVLAMIFTAFVPWGITPTVTPIPTLLPKPYKLLCTDRRTINAPPLISISFEPVALSPVAKARLPVVLPGYLLPEDGPDAELAHAGY